ncbi:MAG: hypothetical protein ABJC79_12305 [Acidimicrobiia bacterium]
MAEVGMRDDPDLGEGLERPVHRREVHLGMLDPDQVRDVPGAEVTIGAEQ